MGTIKNNPQWDVIALHSGVILEVHGTARCRGEICCIHNPTDHHMITWPQAWRGDRRLMERVCPHGVGHPDPDDYRVRRNIPGTSTHGCDGCCTTVPVIPGDGGPHRTISPSD